MAELLAAGCEKAWLHAEWEDTMQKWYDWLVEMKMKDERRKMEELHQQRVSQMIKSADGSAGLLHKITKPAAWRGGAQISEKGEEDVRLLDRCEAKMKEWAKHWQCDQSCGERMQWRCLPAERLKLRRQMAAAAGEKGTRSLSLFVEAFGLEVEEEISTIVTQAWAEGVWVGKWCTEQKEACMRQIFEVQTWRQVRRFAGVVMCGTPDLGIKWPQRHPLTFEGQVQVDMRHVCPKDVKEKGHETGEIDLPEEVGSEARV